MIKNLLLQMMTVLGLSLYAQPQFSSIPTGTTSPITELVMHDDTLVILGILNYFAKCNDGDKSITPFISQNPLNYRNLDPRVVINRHYLLSVKGIPYDHNYVLKSIHSEKNLSLNRQSRIKY